MREGNSVHGTTMDAGGASRAAGAASLTSITWRAAGVSGRSQSTRTPAVSGMSMMSEGRTLEEDVRLAAGSSMLSRLEDACLPGGSNNYGDAAAAESLRRVLSLNVDNAVSATAAAHQANSSSGALDTLHAEDVASPVIASAPTSCREAETASVPVVIPHHSTSLGLESTDRAAVPGRDVLTPAASRALLSPGAAKSVSVATGLCAPVPSTGLRYGSAASAAKVGISAAAGPSSSPVAVGSVESVASAGAIAGMKDQLQDAYEKRETQLRAQLALDKQKLELDVRVAQDALLVEQGKRSDMTAEVAKLKGRLHDMELAAKTDADGNIQRLREQHRVEVQQLTHELCEARLKHSKGGGVPSTESEAAFRTKIKSQESAIATASSALRAQSDYITELDGRVAQLTQELHTAKKDTAGGAAPNAEAATALLAQQQSDAERIGVLEARVLSLTSQLERRGTEVTAVVEQKDSEIDQLERMLRQESGRVANSIRDHMTAMKDLEATRDEEVQELKKVIDDLLLQQKQRERLTDSLREQLAAKDDSIAHLEANLRSSLNGAAKAAASPMKPSADAAVVEKLRQEMATKDGLITQLRGDLAALLQERSQLQQSQSQDAATPAAGTGPPPQPPMAFVGMGALGLGQSAAGGTAAPTASQQALPTAHPAVLRRMESSGALSPSQRSPSRTPQHPASPGTGPAESTYSLAGYGSELRHIASNIGDAGPGLSIPQGADMNAGMLNIKRVVSTGVADTESVGGLPPTLHIPPGAVPQAAQLSAEGAQRIQQLEAALREKQDANSLLQNGLRDVMGQLETRLAADARSREQERQCWTGRVQNLETALRTVVSSVQAYAADTPLPAAATEVVMEALGIDIAPTPAPAQPPVHSQTKPAPCDDASNSPPPTPACSAPVPSTQYQPQPSAQDPCVSRDVGVRAVSPAPERPPPAGLEAPALCEEPEAAVRPLDEDGQDLEKVMQTVSAALGDSDPGPTAAAAAPQSTPAPAAHQHPLGKVGRGVGTVGGGLSRLREALTTDAALPVEVEASPRVVAPAPAAGPTSLNTSRITHHEEMGDAHGGAGGSRAFDQDILQRIETHLQRMVGADTPDGEGGRLKQELSEKRTALHTLHRKYKAAKAQLAEQAKHNTEITKELSHLSLLVTTQDARAPPQRSSRSASRGREAAMRRRSTSSGRNSKQPPPPPPQRSASSSGGTQRPPVIAASSGRLSWMSARR